MLNFSENNKEYNKQELRKTFRTQGKDDLVVFLYAPYFE